MAKPDRKKWPTLAAYWDDYGHMIAFEDLVDMKIRSDGHYVVLAWQPDPKNPDLLELADIASNGTNWEMQNDASDYITRKQWRGLKIVPECDWYTLPDEA